jgi:hypothetical protein
MLRALTAKPPQIPTKTRPKHVIGVKGKLKVAIELIVFEGKALDEAAKGAGLTTYTLRQALGKAHVIAHLKARREVLRASICGSNILRLGQIRDAADNMPAIQAIRTLEDLDAAPATAGSGASASPGITIRIINQAPAQPMIDVTPDLSTARAVEGE